jgi:hypothetical protein
MSKTQRTERPHNRHWAVPSWLRRVWVRRVRARLRQRLTRCEDFDGYVEVKDKRVGNQREWY